MTAKKTKSMLSDIRIWIMLAFITRLYGITNPPLEIGHNWRQSLTNMIARNFTEGFPNILYPRIDMCGNGLGIIGSEFPLFNYLISLFIELFGYTHWYGRLINLLVSSFGIFYFYKLCEKILGVQKAFNAAIILLVSIWFAFSRKIMPDTFSVALVISGMYFGYCYLTKGKQHQLVLYFLLTCIGMLCKIPAMSLLAVLPILTWIKEIDRPRKVLIILTSFLSVFLTGLWYFFWVPHLVKTYQYALYFPKGLLEGFKEIIPFANDFQQRFTFTTFYSFVALLPFITGIFMLFRQKQRNLKIGIGLITFIFFAFILKTGAVFPLHNYYIIPFVPVMCIVAALGLDIIPVKLQYLFLGAIAFESIANQFYDFRIPENEKYKANLESIVDAYIPKGKLIVINGTQSPQEIYFAHRKGWTVSNEVINRKDLDSLGIFGANYLVLNKKDQPPTIDYYPELYADTHYAIYEIKN